MSSAVLKTIPDTKPVLTPDVVILANDLERFNGFAEFLKKNGFNCQVFDAVEFSQFETTKPDTVFYVSFNFKGANPISLAQDLEQRLGMTCIVFAESDDFQTAAKLSSAKMTQTLQHPYTQKNFLMALQTIVKNRKAEFDKEQRRMSHQRHELRQDVVHDKGVIIQKGITSETSTTTVIHGEKGESASLLQQGLKTNTKVAVIAGEETQSHMIIQQGEKLDRNSRQFEAIETEKDRHKYFSESSAPVRQPHPLQANEKMDKPVVTATENPLKDKPRIAAGVLRETREHPNTAIAKDEFDWEGLQKSMDQQFMDNKWAILGVSLLGILICCYCLYQMIMMGR